MGKIKQIFGIALFSMIQSLLNQAKADSQTPYNDLILRTVKQMPAYGGYSVAPLAFSNLERAINVKDGALKVTPQTAQPSFCSASTYLVFTQVLSEIQKSGQLKLKSSDWESFLVADPKTQPDGYGVWGRWNANGPGTARLFSELRIGKSFTNLSDALPGDFLKIFWTDEIGMKERGHSVIFMGTKDDGEGRKICYWSANKSSASEPQGGMGIKCTDERKIRRMLFSRLETPRSLETSLSEIAVTSKKYKDPYLHNLLKAASTPEEMCKQVQCLR